MINTTEMAMDLIQVARHVDATGVVPFTIAVTNTEVIHIAIITIGTEDREAVVKAFDLKPNNGPNIPAAEQVLSVGMWHGIDIVVNHIDYKVWIETMKAS